MRKEGKRITHLFLRKITIHLKQNRQASEIIEGKHDMGSLYETRYSDKHF